MMQTSKFFLHDSCSKLNCCILWTDYQLGLAKLINSEHNYLIIQIQIVPFKTVQYIFIDIICCCFQPERKGSLLNKFGPKNQPSPIGQQVKMIKKLSTYGKHFIFLNLLFFSIIEFFALRANNSSKNSWKLEIWITASFFISKLTNLPKFIQYFRMVNSHYWHKNSQSLYLWEFGILFCLRLYNDH